tara:strand:- start:18954 stop:19997 length:1044 start_codon:yes stop_codon:yes gene_type:complete
MKQFLFIKTASEVYTIPASALKVVEYASDTSVALLFETHKDGKENTITVRLSITSGKAPDVIAAISSQIANSNATVFKYDDINDTFFTKNVTGIGTIVVTTPTDSIAGTNVTSVGETGGTKFLREDGDGTCSFQTVPTGTPTTVTVADESSDTTCFPLFVTAATGDLAPKTGSNFSFNSSTGDLTVDGSLTAKTMHFISCTFFDDIGTTKHYLPLNGPPTEQTSDGNSYTDFLCPCNIVVKSVIVKLPTVTTGSGNLTISVEKTEINTTPGSTPTSVESETLAIADSDDNHVAYFNFDNAAVEVGANLQIGIQSDGDLSSSQNFHTNVIIEMDWSTRYTGSSSVKDS